MYRHNRRKNGIFPWQGWIASLLLFAALVSLVRLPTLLPPPPDDAPKSASTPTTATGAVGVNKGVPVYDSVKQTVRTAASMTDAIPISLEDGSTSIAFVECTISTPNAASHAAATTTTTKPIEGKIRIAVRRDLAPNVSNAFLSLVSSGHFDGNYIFRVLKGFIAQWGIEGPETKKRLGGGRKFPKATIDPVLEGRSLSNVRGTMNFAGGHTASGQVYVNKKDNKYLDKEGGEGASLPFATLDEESMRVVDGIYEEYQGGMGQVPAVNKGDAEVAEKFPMMSRIETCVVVV